MSKKIYFTDAADSAYLNNLKINDDEFVGNADRYRDLLENISECYTVYLATLEDLSRKLEGNFAKNIANFAAVLSILVDSDIIKGEGKRIGNKMRSYIEALDDADKDLY